jgi:hypothetical protein
VLISDLKRLFQHTNAPILFMNFGGSRIRILYIVFSFMTGYCAAIKRNYPATCADVRDYLLLRFRPDTAGFDKNAAFPLINLLVFKK